MRISSTDRSILLHASLVVVLVRAALWVLPARRLLQMTARLQDRLARDGARGVDWPVQRVAWGVAAASRFVPAATCLTQALATQLLLARTGRRSLLRLGVARDVDGTIAAHAWVEFDSQPIIGGGALERYALLPDLRGMIAPHGTHHPPATPRAVRVGERR